MTTPRDSKGGRQAGENLIHCMLEFTLNLRIFCRSTARVLLVAVPRVQQQLGWSCVDFLGAFCVRHKGQGGGGVDAGSQSQVLGPLPISFRAAVDIHIS